MFKKRRDSFSEEQFELSEPLPSIVEVAELDSSLAHRSTPGVISKKPTVQLRTAMGDYVVPEGGKPLTCLGQSRPGPADYLPKVDIIKPGIPQYSIAGRAKPIGGNKRSYIPGPNGYNTSGDNVWKDRTITIKGMLPNYHDIEAKRVKDFNGAYYPKTGTMGEQGPKHKIGRRTDNIPYTGPHNTLINPVDCPGFSTPGPIYDLNPKYWDNSPKTSIGNLIQPLPRDKRPGPSDYDTRRKKTGPAHSFGVKLPTSVALQIRTTKCNPASNNYDIGTTVGKCPAYSIKGRGKCCIQPKPGPCPTSYYRNKGMYRDKGTTLNFRRFDVAEKQKPGPADHDVKFVNLPTQPKYSISAKTKSTYPESQHDRADPNRPGPNAYNVTEPKPKNMITMKARIEPVDKKKGYPGPCTYNVTKNDPEGTKRAPAYSIGQQLPIPILMKDTPGPGTYYPKDIEREANHYSIGKRLDRKDKSRNPVSPNRYTLPELLVNKQKGVAFKSRGSPYIYSGFRTTQFDEPRVPVQQPT